MVGIGVVMATVMFISLMIYFFMSLHEVEEELFTVAKLPILLDMFMESFLVIVLSVPEGFKIIIIKLLVFRIANGFNFIISFYSQKIIAIGNNNKETKCLLCNGRL